MISGDFTVCVIFDESELELLGKSVLNQVYLHGLTRDT